MNSLDLWELYATINKSDDSLLLLKNILNDCRLDDRIDRDMLVMEILTESGDLEPIYNTTNTYYLFGCQFFNTHYNSFKRLLDIETSNYNPLTDYEGVRHYTTGKSGKDVYDHDNMTSHSGSDVDTSIHQVSADNENDFQNRDKSVDTTEYGNKKQDTGTNTTTYGNITTHDYEESGRKTAAQDLIVKEIENLQRIAIYRTIAVEFTKFMCILVS